MAQPEFKVQVSIIKWLREVMPDAMIHHSRNEIMKRGKGGMIDAQRAKAAGVMKGFPDLIVMPYANIGVFFLEVKAPKGRTSDSQKFVHDMLRKRGYAVGVVRSIDETRTFLQENNIGFREVVL